MPEEIEEKPEETSQEEPEGPEENEEESSEEIGGLTGMGNLFSPEGVFMLLIAAFFDLLSIICAILILFVGVGLLASKIVYAMGLIFIGGWALFRPGGALPTKKKGKGGKMTEVAKEKLGKFFKKHWKTLGAKLIPVVGDIIPYWTITVYEELTS